jgi:elongation factor Tu
VVGIRPTRKTVVTGVEMFNKSMDSAQAGDNIGRLLRGVRRDDIERGQGPGPAGDDHAPHQVQGRGVRVEQGGGGTPHAVLLQLPAPVLLQDDRRDGEIRLEEGVEMVMPGDNTVMNVELISPIAMDEGLNFAIREGGRTVGAGVVTEIVE